ncbi:MAG: glycogen synthase GlgA [Candidatus Binatia bacterium]
MLSDHREPHPSVVFVSAELTPLATSGGLGDVSRALPRALAMLGHRVSVVLPLYRAVRQRGVKLETAGEIELPGSGRFRVHQAPGVLAPASLYLVEHDGYFDRPGLYGEGGRDYGDNLERFGFFCRAALETIAALGLPAAVIHANDWQSGLVPALLNTTYAAHRGLRESTSVFTIHNLAYQGRFAADRLPATGLPGSTFHSNGVEYYGGINLMKAGIVYADVVTTVSPRYAEEIRTPEFGEGLDGLLRARGAALVGILNGIDEQAWNPATDRHLPARYGSEALGGKGVCKQALLAETGLPISPDMPLVGMVTRLSSQKGVDIVLGVIHEVLDCGVALVLLGSGDPGLEEWARDVARRRADRVATRIGFDEALAHRIEAGTDMFLMPSRYEPSGLNQMYSLRYGTVPVVRATGGLDDTVRDPEEDRVGANGFKFRRPWGTDLVSALARAVAAYHDGTTWHRLMRNGMAEDFSWRRSARRYGDLYRQLKA